MSWFARISIIATFASATVTQAADSSAGSSVAPEAGAGLEEIVVTAQRREENSQKAAVAVTALSGETLTNAGVVSPQDLTKLLPAANIAPLAGGSLQVLLRGVGSFAGNAQADPGVGVNFDGIYIARAQAQDILMYDLDRVELLKGPQGTLYGRNSTAGALNLISRKPDLSEFGADVTAEVGNYNLDHETFGVNIPVIADKFAVRISGNLVNRTGYLTDGYDDSHQKGARIQALLKPIEDLSILLSADYEKQDGRGIGAVLYPFADPGHPYNGPTQGPLNAYLAQASLGITGGATDALLPFVGTNGYLDDHTYGVNGNIEYRFAGMALTVVPSVRWTDFKDLHYGAGFPVEDEARSRETTTEVRLASDNDEPLKWLVGAYYFYERVPFDLSFQQGVAAADNHLNDLNTLSESGFAQLTYSILPSLRLTGGVRDTREHKTQDGFVDYGPGLTVPVEGDVTFKKVTWKGGVDYDLADNSLLFFNAATGFKAGGFYFSEPPNTFLPEQLTAYTLGSKNRFLDNTLQINFEGFYWKYKDKQVNHLAPVTPVGFNLITVNAGAATIYGLETDIVWKLSRQDTFTATIELEHSNYGQFSYTQTTLTGPPVTGCKVTPVDATDVTVDCSGHALSYAPDAIVNLSLEHVFELPNSSTIAANISTSLASNSNVGDEFLPSEVQGFNTTTNLRLTWASLKSHWSVAGYVDNVEDHAVVASTFVQPILGVPLAVLRPPRTFGIRANYHY